MVYVSRFEESGAATDYKLQIKTTNPRIPGETYYALSIDTSRKRWGGMVLAGTFDLSDKNVYLGWESDGNGPSMLVVNAKIKNQI
jgi:hypothetical protein